MQFFIKWKRRLTTGAYHYQRKYSKSSFSLMLFLCSQHAPSKILPRSKKHNPIKVVCRGMPGKISYAVPIELSIIPPIINMVAKTMIFFIFGSFCPIIGSMLCLQLLIVIIPYYVYKCKISLKNSKLIFIIKIICNSIINSPSQSILILFF